MDLAAHAGVCPVDVGVGGGSGDVEEEKGEEEEERDCGSISTKIEGFFCKTFGICLIWTMRPPDPTAEKSGDVATLAAHLLLRESY